MPQITHKIYQPLTVPTSNVKIVLGKAKGTEFEPSCGLRAMYIQATNESSKKQINEQEYGYLNIFGPS